MTTPPNMNKHAWHTHDWLIELDKIITFGQDWLCAQPLRSEADIPSVTAAKQIADEACQFASSISAAIKLNHTTAAYANLRPLVDRLFHAARFLENPMDAMDWAYWSNAELHRLLGAVLEGGSINPENRDAIRDIRRAIRHWNRDPAGKDRPMRKPGAYPWRQTLDALTKDAHPRLKALIASLPHMFTLLTARWLHLTWASIISCPNPFGSPPPQSLSAQHLWHKIHRFLLLTPLTQICSV